MCGLSAASHAMGRQTDTWAQCTHGPPKGRYTKKTAKQKPLQVTTRNDVYSEILWTRHIPRNAKPEQQWYVYLNLKVMKRKQLLVVHSDFRRESMHFKCLLLYRLVLWN